MRVGIIEILALPSQRWVDTVHHTFITKQYVSVTPQAVSVWCRQLGHETFYAIYYGVGDARSLLPSDLDIVFVACYTKTSTMMKRRIKSASYWKIKFIYRFWAIEAKKDNNVYRRILEQLRSDSRFRAFHEGRSEVLPEFYRKEYDKMLGPYAELLSQSERTPNLEHINPVLSGKADISKISG